MAVRRGPGDLYGMVPRRVFPPFLRAEKWGRPQAKRLRPVPVSAAAGDSPSLCGFASCLFDSLPHPVASGGPLSLTAQRKRRKKCAKGNLSRRRFPLESFPIGQGAAAPLRSPGGLRETKDERQETKNERQETKEIAYIAAVSPPFRCISAFLFPLHYLERE